MQQVHIVYGLGLGDSEDVWEVCSVHGSLATAQQRAVDNAAECEGVQYKVESYELEA